MDQNKMQDVRLEKVTLNIGVGAPGERLENAKTLLERISGKKAVLTKSRSRNPTFKIRKGDNIGAKVTLRGTGAAEIIKKGLDVLDFTLKEDNFDKYGNVSFGVKEYIDFPGIKYDPQIGMMGFDVNVTLKKAGKRIAKRRIAKKKLPQKQKVTKEESKKFMADNFQIKFAVEEEEAW